MSSRQSPTCFLLISLLILFQMWVPPVSETFAVSKQAIETSRSLFPDFLTHGSLLLKSCVFAYIIIVISS